jgi:nucleoside-diphosphate-sugar epimerase
MTSKHVIFGFGPVGRTLATRLVAAGESVRIVTRKRHTIPGAEPWKTDAAIADNARKAAKDAEVIYNCTNVDYTKWPELLPPLYQSILQAAISNQAKYVYMDNLYMYGPVTGPMTEALPNAATGPKGALRGQLANDVLKAHQSGKVCAVILRASHFYGPFVENAVLSLSALKAIQSGKSVPVLGNPNLPHSLTYMPDVAAALEIAGRDPRADGQIWHIPSAPAVSIRQTIEEFAAAIGKPTKLMVATRPLVTIFGLFSPLMRSLKETLYQWESPYILDSQKFQTTFDLHPTPRADAIRQTVASM